MKESDGIHILLLNASERVFGAEKSLASLISLLRGNLFRFSLLSPGGSAEKLFRSVGCEETHPFPFRILRKSKNPFTLIGQAFWILWANLRMIRVLRSIRPEILHVNGMQAMMSVLLASKVMRIPVVWHVRDLDRPRRLAAICAGASKALIVASHTVREQCEVITRKYESKIILAPNPIFSSDADLPTESFKDTRSAFYEMNRVGSGNKKFRIGLVGQIIPRKGHDLLLEALPAILEKAPHVEVYFYGDDPFHSDSPYIRSLRQMVEDSDLMQGHVYFEGYHDNPKEIFGNLDLVAVPSRSEAFGRVGLEAMAFGCPVVAARTGGLAEIVEDGVTGLLFTLGDADALARSIIDLVTDNAQRRKLTEGGRIAFEKHRTEAQEGSSQIASLYVSLSA